MKPKISVIVPVYNVEPYLKRCLDSLINQSMKEIEVLVIDDGSTDRSGDICDDYAANDKRIKVIHQKNSGLSCARNVGLNQSQGKYIMFVDSDDYVEKDFCKIPFDIAKKNEASIVMLKNNYISDSNRYTGSDTDLINNVSVQESIDIMLKHTGVAVWNKLFRIELFEGVRFPIGLYFEDCSLYNYTFRVNSLSHTKDSIKRFDYIFAYYKMFVDLKELSYECYIRPDILKCCLRYLYLKGVNNVLSNKANTLVLYFNYVREN